MFVGVYYSTDPDIDQTRRRPVGNVRRETRRIRNIAETPGVRIIVTSLRGIKARDRLKKEELIIIIFSLIRLIKLLFSLIIIDAK